MTPVRKRGRPSSSTENGVASVSQTSRASRSADSAIGRCAGVRDVLLREGPRGAQCEGRKKSQSPHEDLDRRPLDSVVASWAHS